MWNVVGRSMHDHGSGDEFGYVMVLALIIHVK